MRSVLAPVLVALLVLPTLILASARVGADEDADRLQKGMRNPPATGLLVIEVVAGTQAANKGVRVGDVVVSYDGMPTQTIESLGAAKQAASEKESVTMEVAGHDGTVKRHVLVPGRIGLDLIPVRKGEAVPPLPADTGVRLDFSSLGTTPVNAWYAFHMGDGPKAGFEHVMLERDPGQGNAVVLRREVAFDGGEAWGVNHFDVTISFADSPTLRLRGVSFENPLTRWRSTIRAHVAADGRRTWRWTATVPGKEPETRSFVLPGGLPVIPTYFVESLVPFMPLEKGACLRFRPLTEAAGTVGRMNALVVVGRETIEHDGRPVSAWRFEQLKLAGARAGIYWTDDNGRVLSAYYGAAHARLTTREKALADLHAEITPRTGRLPARGD